MAAKLRDALSFGCEISAFDLADMVSSRYFRAKDCR